MLTSRPFGSLSQAKLRSIVMLRSSSSARRSGSMPVKALTSVDFPWSTWPAVPIQLMDNYSRDNYSWAWLTASWARLTVRVNLTIHGNAPGWGWNLNRAIRWRWHGLGYCNDSFQYTLRGGF